MNNLNNKNETQVAILETEGTIIDAQSNNSQSHHDDNNPLKKRKLSHTTITTGSTTPNNDIPCKTNHSSNYKVTSKCKSKKPKTKHLNPLILTLRRTIQQCCATNDFHTAKLAYQDFHVNQNVELEPQSFYNLLNLCEGGLGGERGIHIGTPKNNKNIQQKPTDFNDKDDINDNDDDKDKKETSSNSNVYNSPTQRKEFAFQIKNEMDTLQIPLNETAYTALMRILCQPQNNNLKQAEELLDQAERTQQCKPKLRMYSCLIDAFCHEDNNDLVGALRVWRRISNLQRKNKNGLDQSAIEITEREYCSLMKCVIRIGDLEVMERILSDIAEDVLVPSIDTKDTIASWFRSKYAVVNVKSETSAIHSVQDLPKSDAPSMGSIQYLIDSNDRKNGEEKTRPFWEITTGDSIDSKNGILTSGCLKGEALKPVQVSTQAWARMIEMNEDIVVKGELAEHGNVPFAGGGKGKKRLLVKDSMEKRIRQWDDFKAFLFQRVGPPCDIRNLSVDRCGKKRFDVVIDGANVGYFKRNFANAPKYVDYKQIDWVIEHFSSNGNNILLIMHERHFGKKLMPKWAEGIVKKWDDAGILYRTPHGSNDDWFWMHAALWCGHGTQVLSNDLMRDHHFQMLAYRSFLRWKERHQVNFDFGDWNGNKREVKLKRPGVYSRRIQRIKGEEEVVGLVIPLPKRGDENRFLDGLHQADETAPLDETYVCIRLRR